MTDYQAQVSYDPLIPINPSQNPSNPLEVSPSDNFNGTNPVKTLIKRRSQIWVASVVSIVFFMLGSAFTAHIVIEGMGTNGFSVYPSFFTFFVLITGYTLGSLVTISTKIYIDNSTGIITITRRKTFCCFNVSMKIQINEIEQAFIKEIVDDEFPNSYELFFRLLNGNEIPICVYESKDESYKYFNIIKNALPQNIIFNDNIVH